MPSTPDTITVTVDVSTIPHVRELLDRYTRCVQLLAATVSAYACHYHAEPGGDPYCTLHMHVAPCPVGEAQRFLAALDDHLDPEPSPGDDDYKAPASDA